MKKRFRSLAFASILALILTLSILAAARQPIFTDVPKTHWAYEAIQTMAEGGMVSGYGGQKFGPDDTITIAHMATIIGNAKGNPAKAGPDGYWAYGNIDYCINTLRCLPQQGEITSANYDKPVSRELAIYMLMNGLGAKKSTATVINATDIPDFGYITAYARESVLQAYKNGILFGKDKAHTFGPQDYLTRAQMCAVFYRSGWTTAAPPVIDVEEGTALVGKDLFEAIKQMSDVTWKETTETNAVVLKAQERKYGGIEVTYIKDSSCIRIRADERPYDLIYNADGYQLDVAGNVIPFFSGTYEKFPSPSGYSYEARQLI